MQPSAPEIERRSTVIRAAAAAAGLDAVLVCGNEYTGFEGAVRYLSGFRIVHRFCFVLLLPGGSLALVHPREARWVGRHADTWLADQVFAERPGAWLRERLQEEGVRRLGVYGLDEVMPVREFRALSQGAFELVPFDAAFDLARAVKSEEELESVRLSMRINEEGFHVVAGAYEPGRTEAELMALAEKRFVELGCGRLTMDMVLSGRNGNAEPEFRLPDFERRIEADDLLLYSLEVAGPGGHWVEFSRPIIAGRPSADVERMLEAYRESFDGLRTAMRDGASAHDVHHACSEPFRSRRYRLGHVTGHSIGMTMIELPRIGEGEDVELRENMVLSMHPHVLTEDECSCFFMQETWRVGRDGGEQLSRTPVALFGRG